MSVPNFSSGDWASKRFGGLVVVGDCGAGFSGRAEFGDSLLFVVPPEQVRPVFLRAQAALFFFPILDFLVVAAE